MKRNKYIGYFILILILFFSINTIGFSSPYRIGFSLTSMEHPFFVELSEAMQEEAEKLGVELTIYQADGDPLKQLSQVEDLIVQKLDFIMLNPTDAQALVPAAEALNDSGIPWFSVDRFVDAPGAILHVGASALMGGQMGAIALVEALDGKGKVIFIEGQPGQSTVRDRNAGFNGIIKDYPEIEVITRQPTDGSRLSGMQVMENLLQVHHDFDAVYCHDDSIALGALEALDMVGLTGEVVLIGCGAFGDIFDAIRDGSVYATVSFDPRLTGVDAIQTAVKLLEGKPIDRIYFLQEENYMPWLVTKALIVDKKSLEEENN